MKPLLILFFTTFFSLSGAEECFATNVTDLSKIYNSGINKVEEVADNQKELIIGIIDTFSPQFYINCFSRTLDYLREKLPNYHLKVVELNPENPLEEFSKKSPHFIVSNSGVFVSLSSHGLQQVSTFIQNPDLNSTDSVGSVIFVRNNNKNINTLADLKGKSVAVQHKNSFDSYLIALGEIAAIGYDPFNFFGKIVETKYSFPGPITLVRSNVTEVGILGLEEWHRHSQEPGWRENEFKIINLKDKSIPVSTALYREFPAVSYSRRQEAR